jgi:peptide/nickel transport system permease protein
MPVRAIVQKLIRAALTVLLLLTTVFVVLRLSGDPAVYVLGIDADPDALEAYRKQHRLDRPIHEQYLRFLEDATEGHFGQSFMEGRDALEAVMDRLPRTLLLMSVTLGVTLLIGIPAGIFSALRRGSWMDKGIMAVTVASFCLPSFVLGIFLILLLSVTWRILPTAGYQTWQHMVLPVITMATADAAIFARFTRSAMLEVLGQPYMRTARAKGLPWARAVIRHALPNAAIPTVTIGGFAVGSLIAGAVVTESVFAWPGVGRLLVTSVQNRDLPVVQVIIVLVAISMVTTNLLVDLTYGWLDPRIRGLMGRRAEAKP